MNTTKTAAAVTQPLTVTPCRLFHNGNDVTSFVSLDTLDPSTDTFAIAQWTNASDASVSFTISREKITLVVHNPENLVLSPPKLELKLPPLEIRVSNATGETVMQVPGTTNLFSQGTVTRSGLDTDLIIGINLDGSSSSALPPSDGYYRLSWQVNGCPRTLEFAGAPAAATSSNGVLILKPKRLD
jgi:hypothetical protein